MAGRGQKRDDGTAQRKGDVRSGARPIPPAGPIKGVFGESRAEETPRREPPFAGMFGKARPPQPEPPASEIGEES